MKLVVLNKSIADKVRGVWKRHKGHDIEVLAPVEVEKDTWYILSFDTINLLKPILNRNARFLELFNSNIKVFTVGDNSTIDKKYQTYLKNTNDITLKMSNK